MKKHLILLIIVFLSVINVNAQFKRRFFNDVEINKVSKAEIGETLITKGQEDYQEALRITECPDFKINFVKFPYKAGDILPFIKTNKKNYDLYSSPEKKDYLDSGTIGIAFDKIKNLYVPYIDSYNGFLTKDQKGNLKVELTEYVNQDCQDCFKKVFIYTGKSGNIIKFSYKEFINNMARPAFTQDVEYDLNDGNIIGIKGLRIEILKTSNIEVEYKILNSFN